MMTEHMMNYDEQNNTKSKDLSICLPVPFFTLSIFYE